MSLITILTVLFLAVVFVSVQDVFLDRVLEKHIDSDNFIVNYYYEESRFTPVRQQFVLFLLGLPAYVLFCWMVIGFLV